MALNLGELVAIISADDSAFHRTLDRVHASLMKVGKFAGFAALAGSAVSFAAAIAPAAGALLVLPAAAAGAKVAMVALSLALDGVSDTLKQAVAGDMDKFNKKLAELAPAARTVVGEFGKALFGLKDVAQQAFFTSLAPAAQGFSKIFAGPLKAGIGSVAAALGRVGASVVGVAKEGKSLTFLKDLFANVTLGIDGANAGVAPFLRGLRDITAVFVPNLNSGGVAVGNILAKIGEWLSKISKSGQALTWFNNAKQTIGQVFAIVKNLGTALFNIFAQAKGPGDGLLTTIEQLTAKFAEWTASAGGKSQIGETFALLTSIATNLMTILPGVASVIATIANAFTSLPAPVQGVVSQMLAWSLVIGLVAGKIGPLLLGVGKVAGGIKAASAAFGEGGKMRQWATSVADVGKKALKAGADAAKGAAQAIAAWARTAAAATANAAKAVAALVVQGAKWVWLGIQSLLAAAKVAAAWLLALGPIGIIIAAVIAAVALIILNWDKVKAFMGKLWDGIKAAAQAAWDGIKNVLSKAFEAIKFLFFNFTGPGLLIKHWDTIKNATSTAWNFIKGLPGKALEAIKQLFLNFTGPGLIIKHWDKIKSATTSAWNAVKNLVSNAWNAIKTAVTNGVAKVVSVVVGIKAKITGAVSGFNTLLVNAGKAVIQGLINGIKGMLGSLGSTMSGVASKIKSFLPFSPAKTGPLSGSGAPQNSGKSIVRQLAQGMAGETAAIDSAMLQVAGRIKIPGAGGGASVPTVNLPGRAGGVRGGDGAALHIENYHEAPTRSVRATAEEILMLSRARG